ncbi:MAG: hypothetical protein LBQ49_02350, partial [Rickettsiales bacterium]|nr:hypothetical protein [Rickettsiales bacterium]
LSCHPYIVKTGRKCKSIRDSRFGIRIDISGFGIRDSGFVLIFRDSGFVLIFRDSGFAIRDSY